MEAPITPRASRSARAVALIDMRDQLLLQKLRIALIGVVLRHAVNRVDHYRHQRRNVAAMTEIV
jgi:hypothetical protein